MTSLSDYKLSIRRLIEAPDLASGLEAEGYASDAAVLDGQALRAKRSLLTGGGDASFKRDDKMSHRKIVR